MGTEEPELGATDAVRAEHSLGGDADHYTGVVLIHGIGDEKRNETLQEAVNNPDAQASRATIELEPPAALAQEYGALAPLRLEFCEKLF